MNNCVTTIIMIQMTPMIVCSSIIKKMVKLIVGEIFKKDDLQK